MMQRLQEMTQDISKVIYKKPEAVVTTTALPPLADDLQAGSLAYKHIIFVNSGSYDLDNSSNYLRRAWDDNYSNQYFAGVSLI